MNTYKVETVSDAEGRTIEADYYEITDRGELCFYRNQYSPGEIVELESYFRRGRFIGQAHSFAPGAWIEVRKVDDGQ